MKQREKQAPVNAEDRAVVARREARVPVAVGPREVVVPRRVVEAKPVVAIQTPPVTPPPVTPPPQPEHVATTSPPPVETPAVKAPPVVATSAVLDEEVYFTLGSSTVAANKRSLDKAIRWLKSNADQHATVEGYADPTGAPDANMALSQTRAEAVRDYLVSAGIDSSRLEVTAFGDTKLKYGRTDGRNRRVAVEAKK